MTLEVLAAIEARANAATPGPWEPDDIDPQEEGELMDPSVITFLDQEGRRVCREICGSARTGGLRIDDAAFIAAARTDVPALVARVRELESDLAKWRGIVASQKLATDIIAKCCEVNAGLCGDLLAERDELRASLTPEAAEVLRVLRELGPTTLMDCYGLLPDHRAIAMMDDPPPLDLAIAAMLAADVARGLG